MVLVFSFLLDEINISGGVRKILEQGIHCLKNWKNSTLTKRRIFWKLSKIDSHFLIRISSKWWEESRIKVIFENWRDYIKNIDPKYQKLTPLKNIPKFLFEIFNQVLLKIWRSSNTVTHTSSQVTSFRNYSFDKREVNVKYDTNQESYDKLHESPGVRVI